MYKLEKMLFMWILLSILKTNFPTSTGFEQMVHIFVLCKTCQLHALVLGCILLGWAPSYLLPSV